MANSNYSKVHPSYGRKGAVKVSINKGNKRKNAMPNVKDTYNPNASVPRLKQIPRVAKY